jgi:hypothetical protein
MRIEFAEVAGQCNQECNQELPPQLGENQGLFRLGGRQLLQTPA